MNREIAAVAKKNQTNQVKIVDLKILKILDIPIILIK